MSFIISGDTHGTLDIKKVIDFFEGKDNEYTEDDYLIILGDVGVCGFNPEEEKETRRILRELPVTTLFIDGNHEHFCVTASAQNPLCHNAVSGAENYNNADCGHELACDIYSF